MTAALADFALSDEGRVFAAIADRWGVDPGALFPDDDVLAWNLRAGLMVGTSRRRQVDVSESDIDAQWAAAAQENERIWLGGQ